MALTSPALLSVVRGQIAKHQLEPVADLILERAAECYAIEVTGAEDYSRRGNTRFGGDPDLPTDFPWPVDPDPIDPGRRHANFIAQINFAEFPPLAAGSPLPDRGILYLFVRSMDSAAEPVLLDAHYHDGPRTQLRRRPSPPADQLCDEYLVDLLPHQVRAVPAVSFPFYQKAFRAALEEGRDFNWYDLEPDPPDERIGQVLGYANAGDVRQNLYRQLVLARLGKRPLVYNDYWDSVPEYEAYMAEWKTKGNADLVRMYEAMRAGVNWLVRNRARVRRLVDEWRLLLRLNSNRPMNLSINDWDPLYVFVRDEDLAARRFDDLAGEVTQG